MRIVGICLLAGVTLVTLLICPPIAAIAAYAAWSIWEGGIPT